MTIEEFAPNEMSDEQLRRGGAGSIPELLHMGPA